MTRLYDVLADHGVIVIERGDEGIRAVAMLGCDEEASDPRDGCTGPARADIDAALSGLEDALGEVPMDRRRRRRAS